MIYMKILVDIGHPADVHFFKNIINRLEKEGHSVKITARSKDVVLSLLDSYGHEYEIVGSFGTTFTKKAIGYLKKFHELYKIVNNYSPDVLIGFANPFISQIGYLKRIKSINFTDTEHATLANKLSFPFASKICTPECYFGDVPFKKHITFNGYKELTYLNPQFFSPNKNVYDYLGFDENTNFIVLRFVSWEASHDVGQKGILDKESYVRNLSKHAKIIISSEKPLENSLEQYRLNIPPDKMHDVLYFAQLYIGEGATMASEAAVLGTPALYINSLKLGYMDELEQKYGLVYNFLNPSTAQNDSLSVASQLMEQVNLKDDYEISKKRILAEKDDCVDIITRLIIDID